MLVPFSLAVAMLGNSLACAQSTQPNQTQAQPQQQQQPPAGKQSNESTLTKARPNARYPHPSGQDSPANNASTSTSFPDAASKRGNDPAAAESHKPTGVHAQSNEASRGGQKRAYTGAVGSKQDPSTACSTARPTNDGGIDCGTSGKSATGGRIVTKPH